jgi:hypothetical protein
VRSDAARPRQRGPLLCRVPDKPEAQDERYPVCIADKSAPWVAQNLREDIAVVAGEQLGAIELLEHVESAASSVRTAGHNGFCPAKSAGIYFPPPKRIRTAGQDGQGSIRARPLSIHGPVFVSWEVAI